MSIYTKQITKPLTPKQEKVISLMVENSRINGNTISKGEIMKLAGYSKAIQEVPSKVLNSQTIQDKLKPFIKKLEAKRDLAINELTQKKLKKAGARDTAGVLDILIKNTQLLGGGATANVVISPKERQEVDDAFALNE
jgi:hypothetical protein